MRLIGAFLLLCIFSCFLNGQSADPSTDILPPNPTAAALTKYVDFPVNTSTGIPSVSIPLGTLAANGISVPVSMDYHAGGVKVDEVSSITGLGWSLTAGGAITRTIRGKRDEDVDGFIAHRADVPTPPTIGSTTEYNSLQNFSSGAWDGQPDIFQFNFGNFSGKFVIENSSTIRLIPKQDLKITYSTCTGTGCPVSVEDGSIISFTVTTPDGTQYLFGTIDAVETSKTTNSNVPGYTGCRPKEFTLPTINSWQLKSITNPKNVDVITLNYNSYSISYQAGYNESYRYKDSLNNNALCDNTSTSMKCITTQTDNGKVLSSITSSLGKIEFIQNATRSDVTTISGNYRINEAKIYGRNNQLLKSYQFYQTFIQTTASPVSSSPTTAVATTYRMYLDSISEFSATANKVNTWKFEYYNRSSLPPRLSYKQDHWGYFNNKSNTQLTPAPYNTVASTQFIQAQFSTFNPANRDPDGAYSYYGNIKRITYPTGGYSEYEYEGNTVAVCQTVDVQTAATASADLMYTGTYGQTQTFNFIIDSDQTVPVTYNVQQNGLHFEGAYAKIKRISPSPATVLTKGAQLASPAVITGTDNIFLIAGQYQIEVKVYLAPLGSGYPSPFNTLPDRATMSIPYVDLVPTYIFNKDTGGIRLKKSTTNGVSGSSPGIVKAYQYQKSNPECLNASSALYMGGNPRYLTIAYTEVGVPDPPGSVPQPCDYTTCKYNVLSSASIIPLTNFAGAIVSYRETWALDGAIAENGKKYYRHELFIDGDPLQGTNSYSVFLSTPKVDYSWKSGKLVEEKILNSSGQPVSQKLYDYEFNEATNSTVTQGFVAEKAISPLCGVLTYTTNPPEALRPYAYEWYDIISQFIYLKQTRERVYNSDGTGNFVETVTDYGYDLPAMTHLMPTKTTITNSDDTKYITLSKYPPQYTTTTVTDQASIAIKALKDNFIINQPVETVQSVKKGLVESVVGGQIVKFKNFGGVRILPNELWKVATTTPIATTGFTFSNITGGNFAMDPNYYQTGSLGVYDAKANLTEWNKKDDQVNAFIYGHSLSRPTAYVRNALSTEVAYSSFEEPLATTDANGKWVITGSSAANWSTATGFSKTGRTGFNIGTGRTVKSASLPAGRYVVSFWYRDGRINVNGINLGTVAGTTWLYAETILNLAANSTVTVAGTATTTYLDELRLYPSDALMRTFSFDDNALYVRTISDENCVATQYEYDNSQRLQLVRDQDNNIVQAYEYNYQQANSGLNNIKTYNVLVSGKTTLAQVTALLGAEVQRAFQYLDGLGRPIQSNAVGQSPGQKDIISYQLYDAYGRTPKMYLPYTFTSNSGAYRTGAAAEQVTFANTFGAGGYGYSESSFEVSPLNRVTAQAAPGLAWNASTTHKVGYVYRGNTGAESIRDFTNNTNYSDNALLVTEITDENGKKSMSFTDKAGRTVLTKQQIPATLTGTDATDYAYTYTVYDDFGRVIAILPPETSKKMKAAVSWAYTTGTYSSMVFLYQFDARGRMISKTLPAGGTSTIAYDRLDRPVLSIDAKGFKTFSRYDILSRVVMTGRYKGSAVPGTSGTLFESPNSSAPHYYSAVAFPTDSFDVYQVMYYDDYDIDNNGSIATTEDYANPSETPFDAAAFLRLRGKMTAVKNGVLDNNGTAPSSYLTTRTYYDKEYSVIQVNKQNHLLGSDIVSSAYDFANRLTKTLRDHKATPTGGTAKTYTIREEYVYDHASRLLYTVHQIGTQKKEIIAGQKYDEMGRVLEKNLHSSNYDGITLSTGTNYLQSLDYNYNIRGWLTSINDPTPVTCATQGGDNLADMFNMQLTYDAPTNSGTAQYNGNIATMEWKTNINGLCGERQLYKFSYDGTNRLTAADHRRWNGSAWVDPAKYNESGITYDLNGNIKTYVRQGLISGTTYGTIDNLTYTYGDALRPDRLTQMADAGNSTKGFKYVPLSALYQYDLNGNMTQDNHKGFVIAYNHLNLPITFTKGTSVITITYSADGTKLSKAVTGGGATKNYVSGIEYSGVNVEAIYHGEGRCTPNGTSFFYEYTIKDHLGNARVNFRANGTTATHLEEMHYYPFGMLIEGLGTVSPINDYSYNGKEVNDDFGLNLSDYGARWYDAAVGRWWGVDPLAEKYGGWSGYNYTMGNPVRFIDPDGMSVSGDFLNSNGKKIGSDGRSDGKVYVIKTSEESYTDGQTVPAAGLSKEDAKSAMSFVKENSGDIAAFEKNPSVYGSFTEIVGSAESRQSMVNEVNKDNGEGGTGDSNNREYSGAVNVDGSVSVNEPGEVSNPKSVAHAKGQSATDERPSFHSHPSGSIIEGPSDGTMGTSKEFTFHQPPSNQDIKNAGSANRYVFARGEAKGGTVYIYNNKGVQATLPMNNFVKPK